MVVLSDFIIYWGHRLQHQVGILWRFHAVHHSAEHLDWLAAGREHPVDTIYTVSLVNLPMFALGFPIETITVLIVFRGMWAVFIHTNVRLPLGSLGLLIGAPELHHWHHDRARDAGNYGNLSPIMDLLFGTHYCPEHEPVCFGLKESTATTYLGHILLPFLPRRWAKQISDEVSLQARDPLPRSEVGSDSVDGKATVEDTQTEASGLHSTRQGCQINNPGRSALGD